MRGLCRGGAPRLLGAMLLPLLFSCVQPPRQRTWPGAPVPLEEGYDAVVVADLARIRSLLGEHALGALLTELADARLLILTIHDIGGTDAATVTWILGATAPQRAVAIAPQTYRLGPEVVTAASRFDAIAVRSWAMPRVATSLVWGAAVLSRAARAEMVRRFSIDPPPTGMAFWVDVQDDAAIVIEFAAAEPNDPGAALRLARRLEEFRLRWAAEPTLPVAWRELLAAARVSQRSGRVRLMVLTTPVALAAALRSKY